MVRTRLFRAVVLGALAAALAPASASAATASVVDGVFTYTAGPGETNQVYAFYIGTYVDLMDAGGVGVIEAGPGCENYGEEGFIACEGHPFTRAVVTLGDRDDSFDSDDGFEVDGGPGDDRLTGGPRRDHFEGGPGDDVLDDGEGSGDNESLPADTLSGGPGNDRLLGNNGADVLLGGDGNDVLHGGGANDVFDAGAGDDVIRSRDRDVEDPVCGDGEDVLRADFMDQHTADDCETVDVCGAGARLDEVAFGPADCALGLAGSRVLGP